MRIMVHGFASFFQQLWSDRNIFYENFSIFNDNFRNAIRGDNTPSNGFINGNQHNNTFSWNIVEGLKGSIYTLTSNPSESINYLDAHDNYTLWDQIEKSQNTIISNGSYRKIIDI